MTILAFGINHTTAPVDLRERIIFGGDAMPDALGELTHQQGVDEAAILSTCNRTEVYCSLEKARNENPIQGAFIIEELTDLVEEAVLTEFDNITERGGVLGAMETMYQRSKIQEESLYYETLKHTGEYPIIGVNTFLNKKGSPTIIPEEVIRATEKEKKYQISMLAQLHKGSKDKSVKLLSNLQEAAIQNQNIFELLIEAAKVCSLGEITKALFEVGGQYRRNM